MRYLLAKSIFEATNLEEYKTSVFETSTTQYVVLCMRHSFGFAIELQAVTSYSNQSSN